MGGAPGVPSTPTRTVEVNAFAIDITEVTVGAYAGCIQAGRCPSSAPGQERCNAGRSDRTQHPMNCVDWYQAASYCAFVGKRLPFEEEWEYAARGRDGRSYPWGNDEPKLDPPSHACWGFVQNETCVVASFPSDQSPFGVRDLAGNVSEWTATATPGERRAVRGGHWANSGAKLLNLAHRRDLASSDRSLFVGFRCARSG